MGWMGSWKMRITTVWEREAFNEESFFLPTMRIIAWGNNEHEQGSGIPAGSSYTQIEAGKNHAIE